MRTPRPVVVLVVSVAFCLLSGPFAAEGQQAGKVYRLGYLGIGPPPDGRDTRLDLFRQGLRDLGYVEGRNIALAIRYTGGKPERLPDVAAELVGLNVDVIVTSSGAAAVAAKKATQTIPIVMLTSGDAVRQGLVASLARPGGNVTGFTLISPELSRKRLEILREMLPKLSRVGVLWCGAAGPVAEQEWAETRAAADVLGVQLSSLGAPGRDELVRAFAVAAKQRVQAILVLDCSRLHPSHAHIADLSLKHRLPAMYPLPRYPRAGGLMSYGAKPADLPVEQPSKFELVINLKTAKALRLTMPPSVLARADQVIE